MLVRCGVNQGIEHVQVSGLHAQLDIIPGEDLSALGASNALHRAFLRPAADCDSADCALVFQKLSSNGACRRAHAIVQLMIVSIKHYR